MQYIIKKLKLKIKMSNKKYSISYILDKFNDNDSIKQLKNLKNKLKQYELQEKKEEEKDNNLNEKNISQKEQKIISIISNTLLEKKNYFLNNEQNNDFNYDLFITFLLEIIKQKLSKIIKNSKSIENSLFHKINKNTIKKIQSIIINFIILFYDFYENDSSYTNTDDIIETILSKNIIIEESFLISIIKIILFLNNNLKKEKIKNIFNQSLKENYILIKEVVILLIKSINIFFIVKKNKDLFNIEDNTIIDNNNNLKNNKGYYNFNKFELFINKTYTTNYPRLAKLLYDFIFINNLQIFLSRIIKNDENSNILLNSLSYEKDIRYKLLKLLNESLFVLEKQNQKDLLKSIKNNDSITIIFNYISEDLKNNKYNNISDLLEELKIIYTFSLLIHSHDINTEKIIIKLLNSNIGSINNDNDNEINLDKNNIYLDKFINNIYKLSKNMPKYKYKIYNFLLLIFDSIKSVRKIISQTFFNNLKGNVQEYLEATKNVSFNLFIDNLCNSEDEVINNFFNFLYTLDKDEFLPLNEIIQIIGQLPFFTNIKSLKALINNLEIFTDINYLLNNNINNDICAIENYDDIDNKENKNNNKYYKFIKHIHQSYINILYNIISEIKENINSLKYKSPFDNDVTVSSIINTNYSNINEEENNKKTIPFEILDILIDYLSVIIKDSKMLQYFISLKFLDFFPSLVNDIYYKRIAYKIIHIFLNSPNNNEENKEKNKQQLLMILNRFFRYFNNNSEENEINSNEINNLKELLLMQDTVKIYFTKKLINFWDEKENNNLNEKITNFYFSYTEYINEKCKIIYEIYNDEYHSLIKKYLNIIIEIICISNQNIITKNNNYSPNKLKRYIKTMISNIIKFYYLFPDKDTNKNIYFLDIIKFFIDKSFNFQFSEEKNNYNDENDENNNKFDGEGVLQENDFIEFYIEKYKINREILVDSNDNKNKSIISNFIIQSPMLILYLLKVLFNYNIFLKPYLNFILFLCKINQQNILFLLRQKLLKFLFIILKEIPSFNDIIFQILKISFKYLQKEDICFVFEQIIKLSNNIDSNDSHNKDFIKEILHHLTNSIRILSLVSNDYFKSVILSRYKIKQPNIYNMIEINNIKFYDENNMDLKDNSNILIKQEIYFYKSLKTKKLLLLRVEKEKNNNENNNNFKEKAKNYYLEISFRNSEILISENNDKIQYDDLSNYNSIFIDNDKEKLNIKNYLKINQNNEIIYIFKQNKKILSIYVNGQRVITYKYSFNFTENILIKIGFPLDLVKEQYDNNFKLFNHIKIKSLQIFLQNNETKEINKNIYQLVVGNIACDYVFADELTNFKLDENTKLISKYNNLYSARINTVFHKNIIKTQFYKKIFFTEKLLLHSLDYIFRIEKYIFIILNNLYIDKIIFNELISLLCTYLIINENFIQKFFSKEEFNSTLYFSMYRNVKFIDKETIKNLISIILINDSIQNSTINHSYIIDILLDIKLFNSMSNQSKYDLITIINNKIIHNMQNLINKTYIINQLAKILMLCQFSNKNEIDELLINIIFDFYEYHINDEKSNKIIEEIIYLLFNFDLFTLNHLTKYKNGRIDETSKIIYQYFNKIYNKDVILHIKDLIEKKIEQMLIVTEKKKKLYRILSAYTPPNLSEVSIINKNINNNNNDSFSIISFEEEEDEEEERFLFKLPNYHYGKVRSLSLSVHKNNRPIKMNITNIMNNKNDINKVFTGRVETKKKTVNNMTSKLLFNKKKINKNESHQRLDNFGFSDYRLKLEQCRQKNSIRPIDDVIIFKDRINRKERKSFKNFFKNRKIEKRRSTIFINITDEDKENCEGQCHLCLFIQQILVSMFKREIKFGIYKNYLMHCLTEIFIMNKSLDFKVNFSYYLMKREGPNRIRKKFNIRIDKLLNAEYDRTAYEIRNAKKDENSNKEKKLSNNNNNLIKEKSIEINDNKETVNENEIEKIFMFYENKKAEISENLYNFFNLGQIYNIDIMPHLIEKDDSFQGAYNCLLFKGFSYINAVFILGKNKIYILSTVNISANNILYDAHLPITRRFWVVKKYSDILQNHCKYLNSYDNSENNDNEKDKNNNNQTKKKLFRKTIKGFWLYSFYYVEINEIHKRRFLHQKNAIEIFLNNGKNYYLTFNYGIRDKLVKYIIRNIKYSHQSKNLAFFINNNFNSIKNNENNDNKNENQEINDNLSNMVYEIQNESLMKSDNIIFLMDNNLFIENSKKNKKINYYKNIFNNKKIKFSLATILDINEIIEKCYDKWTNGHLDTYSYLMILNTVSGRTYNDIAQYPIYPWILSNYSSKELDLNKSESYRDFLYPIYAQDEETRENLKIKYESFEEDQKEFKYHSGSHYSNAGFVCYYLIRLKPFSQLAAEVQGEFFDTTDRLFFNIESFYNVSEKYQELIPDVFNTPELLINLNEFNLGLNSEGNNIDNVALPPWASHSPRLFCKILKKSIESQYVSMNINNWIDLIFGYKQKGSEAEKYYNVLRNVCSRFNPKKDCENEIEIEQKINELCELGIDPLQIFTKPHHKREKHQKIKAFFGRNIYLPYFKEKGDKYLLKNLENNCIIKEMNKYYEYTSQYLSKGEGGLSSFKMCFDEDNDNNYFDNKEANSNSIYFIISGKKTLLPPSYKNYIQWANNNEFSLIKPFKKIKYDFIINHMKKQSINCIKVTKDGTFIIIGYNNGILEKYKLARIWGPKIKKINKENIENYNKSNSSSSSLTSSGKQTENRVKSNEEIKINKDNNIHNIDMPIENLGRTKEKSVHVKGGLFKTLFGQRNRKNTQAIKYPKRLENTDNNIEKEDDEEENKKIIEAMEKNNRNINEYKFSISNEILFDTQIPISTSNIINSDCIIINNNTGKFIQYNGLSSPLDIPHFTTNENETNEENNNNPNNNIEKDVPGYDIYSNNKNNLNNILNKDNHNNSLSKHYIIFLINSSSRILSEISLIEICEPYSFMLVVDKFNNLYLYDFNTFDLIKHINCSIYFKRNIKYISICPYTGDFILANYYRIILMSINGVFITQMNNIKSKINYCFITSIYKSSSDLYLFSAHEDGNLRISKLINNLNGIIFNMNKISLAPTNTNKLLNSMSIDVLNNKYDPIRIKNISKVYHDAYNTKDINTNDCNINNDYNNKQKMNKYLENNNNFSIIFDTPTEIKCSEYPIKYIKLSQDLSSLICINNKNNVIYLNYEEFFLVKKKNKDKKNMIYCDKCYNIISSSKTLCQICGKKLCSNCKMEKIIPECSLKNPKPICDECNQLMNKNNQNLYDF